MSPAWTDFLHRLRQRRFPAEFRIPPPPSSAALAALAERAARLLEEWRPAGLAPQETNPLPVPERPPAAAEGSGAGVAAPLAVALSDDFWRIRRNADLLAAKAGDSKEMRMILRHLESLGEVFREHGIDCADLTGQEYDIGRTDFEQIGEATPVPGLVTARIAVCERPAVWLRGTLVRPARGLVERPAEGGADA